MPDASAASIAHLSASSHAEEAAYHQSVDKLQKNPLERTWRGNKEGTLKLESVPDFGENLLAKRQWIKVSASLVSGKLAG